GIMLKRYRFWLWIAVVFMFLNAIGHSLSFFITPTPENDTDRQLTLLMTTYRHDLGAGFHPTTMNLFTALSSCYSLLCLLGGLTLAFLLKKQVDRGIIRGLVLINLLVFGICFTMMAIFTFLPPILLTGLIVLFLLISFFALLRGDQTQALAD